MSLEDLTGTKYLNSLNELWPDGAVDTPDAGDDHIRGIKNVLKKSFPNVSGAVTRTHTQLSEGSVPSGSVLAFMQAAAPTGWTRKTGLTTTFGMRIVATASAGGGTGGTDDPILNDKIPSHVHPSVSSTSVTVVGVADHTHGTKWSTLTGGTGFAPGAGYTLTPDNSGAGGAHTHSASAATSTTVSANSGAANWTPRYYDFVLCIKD